MTVPADASYPRLITGRHPRKRGTLGHAVEAWALARPGLHMRGLPGLRWWQRLALRRGLETDKDGRLIWQTILVSAPRQVGKSYLERIVLGWRIHQAARFGAAQDCLHVAHKLTAAQEVWRPAARWSTVTYGKASVRWANGEQMIELGDGSRWMIQAATEGAGVAFSLSLVLVDEAWRVGRHVVDAALAPTMAETEQPQLWLVSTAGTSASDLMLAYRALALALDHPRDDDSLLLMEWSAPPDPDLDIDDPGVWQAASPHWDERRRARVAKARSEVPEVIFRQQWLNQWVPTVTAPLFDPSIWSAIEWVGALPNGRVAFGVDLAPDRSHACIVAISGGVAEVVDFRDGAGWVPGRLTELCGKWSPVAVGLDGSGPAATVADQLRGTEVEPLLVVLTGRQLATGCGVMFDAITSGRFAARATPELERAILHAIKRPYGQSWVFNRANGGTSCVPLLAATVGLWAAEHRTEGVEVSRIW